MKKLINYGVPTLVNAAGAFSIITFANNSTLIALIAIACPLLSYVTGIWIGERLFKE